MTSDRPSGGSQRYFLVDATKLPPNAGNFGGKSKFGGTRVPKLPPIPIGFKSSPDKNTATIGKKRRLSGDNTCNKEISVLSISDIFHRKSFLPHQVRSLATSKIALRHILPPLPPPPSLCSLFSNWYYAPGMAHSTHYYHSNRGIQPLLPKPNRLSILTAIDFNYFKPNYLTSDSSDSEIESSISAQRSLFNFKRKLKSKVKRLTSKTSSGPVMSKILIGGCVDEGPPSYRSTSETFLSKKHHKKLSKKDVSASLSLVDLNNYNMIASSSRTSSAATGSASTSIKSKSSRDPDTQSYSKHHDLFADAIKHHQRQLLDAGSHQDIPTKYTSDHTTSILPLHPSSSNKSNIKRELNFFDHLFTKSTNQKSLAQPKKLSIPSKVKANIKRKFVREPVVNPYPGLVISGTQIEAVASLMCDLIDTTLSNVGELIEETKNRISRFQRNHKEGRSLWQPDLEPLTEEESSGEYTEVEVDEIVIIDGKEYRRKKRITKRYKMLPTGERVYEEKKKRKHKKRRDRAGRRYIDEDGNVHEGESYSDSDSYTSIVDGEGKSTGKKKKRKKNKKLEMIKKKLREKGIKIRSDDEDDLLDQLAMNGIDIDAIMEEDGLVKIPSDILVKIAKTAKKESKKRQKKERHERRRRRRDGSRERDYDSEESGSGKDIDRSSRSRRRRKHGKHKKHRRRYHTSSSESASDGGEDIDEGGRHKGSRKKRKHEKKRKRRHYSSSSSSSSILDSSEMTEEQLKRRDKKRKRREKKKRKHRTKRISSTGEPYTSDDYSSSSYTSDSSSYTSDSSYSGSSYTSRSYSSDSSYTSDYSSTDVSTGEGLTSSAAKRRRKKRHRKRRSSRHRGSSSELEEGQSRRRRKKRSHHNESSSEIEEGHSRRRRKKRSSRHNESSSEPEEGHSRRRRKKRSRRKGSSSDLEEDGQGRSRHKKGRRGRSSRRHKKRSSRGRSDGGSDISDSLDDSFESGDYDSDEKRRRRKKHKKRKKEERKKKRRRGDDRSNLEISYSADTVSKPTTGTSGSGRVSGEYSTAQRRARKAAQKAELRNKLRGSEGFLGSQIFDDDMSREMRNKTIELSLFGDLEMTKAEMLRKRQLEKEEKMRAVEEQKKQEMFLMEHKFKEYDRKEAKKKEIMNRLEKLRHEVSAKQLVHKYHTNVIAEYYEMVDNWDEVDYAYIELYIGTECMERIKESDKKRKLQEAIISEQSLIEALELKREELLLKLEQAHQQFVEMLQNDMNNMSIQDRITRAFVYSYFDCIPDANLQQLIEKVG